MASLPLTSKAMILSAALKALREQRDTTHFPLDLAALTHPETYHNPRKALTSSPTLPTYPLEDSRAPTVLQRMCQIFANGLLNETDAPTKAPTDPYYVIYMEDSHAPTVAPTNAPKLSPTDLPRDRCSNESSDGSNFRKLSWISILQRVPQRIRQRIRRRQVQRMLTTSSPTSSPTTDSPTSSPTDAPTDSPTSSPTDAPTDSPTSSPTDAPTDSPTVALNATDVPTSAGRRKLLS